jgi:hypothetical protein
MAIQSLKFLKFINSVNDENRYFPFEKVENWWLKQQHTSNNHKELNVWD